MTKYAPTVLKITPDALPGILADIARLTDPEVAISVARRYGGRRLYIPTSKMLMDSHPLCELVGRREALIVADSLGGERHNVPAARTILRWYDAHCLRAAGKTHSQISAALGLTQLYVGRLLAGAPIGEPVREIVHGSVTTAQASCSRLADKRQMNLFE